jgi:transposase-like protein
MNGIDSSRPNCPLCRGGLVKKNGRDRQGRQVYRCLPCRHSFTLISMTPFSGYHVPSEVVTLTVYYYLSRSKTRQKVSYSQVTKWAAVRGVVVDRSTIFDWVRKFRTDHEIAIAHSGIVRVASLHNKWSIRERTHQSSGRTIHMYLAVDETGTLLDFFCADEPDRRKAEAFFGRESDTLGGRMDRVSMFGRHHQMVSRERA